MFKRPLRLIGVIALAIIVLFVAIQLIPVWLLQTNPPVQAEPAWNSPETRALAKRACFDCHSNETAWPTYARIAPVSWLVTFDMIRGRRELNFSEWGVQSSGEGERRGRRGGGEFAEAIQNGSMPPGIYLMMHPSAKLSDQEKQQLIQGLQASLR